MRCVAKRPGRPLGEVALAVLERLEADGPSTARCLAERLQLSVKIVWDTCNRLATNGEIEIAHRRAVPGVNKPVAVYASCRRTPICAAPTRLPASFFLGR